MDNDGSKWMEVRMMEKEPTSRLIHNARLVGLHTITENAWVKIERGVIVEIGVGAEGQPSADERIDARDQWLVPGFIDIHVHGGNGSDVMDGRDDAIRTIGRFHASHGTTGWLPTTVTQSVDRLSQSLSAVERVKKEQSAGAEILGLHLEGPFICLDRRGAQNPAYVQEPNIDTMKQLANVAPGLIRKVTIAPEQPQALDVIRWLSRQGIISSMGHTDATYEEVILGVDAGISHATHLFNAMSSLHHRDGAGAVGACLHLDDIVCELIADGHHVDVNVMKFAVKTKGTDKIILITDAMSAAGQPNGLYDLGGLSVNVEDGVALLTEGHTLAGSTLTLDVAVQNMVKRVGVTLQEAIRMASTNAARDLGLSASKGAIAVGKDADLVLLDESLAVVGTWVSGREVYRR
jgi:N-acetylglucosamine-6-phosphate deacetylase